MVEWTIPELSLWDFVPTWMRECDQSFVHVLVSNDPRYQWWVRAICARPWCDPCERVRLWRFRDRIAKYINWSVTRGISHWWFVTRSVRNSHNARVAFLEFNQTKSEFHRKISRSSHPWSDVDAWIGVQELTYNPGSGYNLHQHMLIGQKGHRHRQKESRKVWSRAAPLRPDGSVQQSMYHCVPMNNIVGAIAYVTKYISKGTWGGLSRGRTYLIRRTLKGRNRIQMMARTGPPVGEPLGMIMCCINAYGSDCGRDATDMDIRVPLWDKLRGNLLEEE